MAAFLAFALIPSDGPADLAVVFGNEVLADGRPSARLAARLDAAAEAYRQGLAPLVLVSGGMGASGFDEASVMRRYLVAAGIPDRAVLEDADGKTTMATARHASAVLRQRGLRSVLVVTQYFHIPRCIAALRLAGVRSVLATYPTFLEPRDVYSTARELVALPYYVLFHSRGA